MEGRLLYSVSRLKRLSQLEIPSEQHLAWCLAEQLGAVGKQTHEASQHSGQPASLDRGLVGKVSGFLSSAGSLGRVSLHNRTSLSHRRMG